jgi:membrane-bound metal-dependent hydrolase YbcI (DUF457 family)
MDSLFHFIFPIIAALAARLNIKHPIRSILGAAFLTLLIDLDHFIGLEGATLHNIFVTVLIPLILLFLSFHFKLNRYIKGFFFLLLIFLSSHVFLDLFSSPVFGSDISIAEGSGVALFYPLSNTRYSINFNIKIPLKTSFPPYAVEGYLVSSLGFGILLYFIIILVPCLFLDDIIEIAERKHKKFIKASKEFLQSIWKD